MKLAFFQFLNHLSFVFESLSADSQDIDVASIEPIQSNLKFYVDYSNL